MSSSGAIPPNLSASFQNKRRKNSFITTGPNIQQLMVRAAVKDTQQQLQQQRKTTQPSQIQPSKSQSDFNRQSVF